MIPPPKEKRRVPFRKIREQIADIYRHLRRTRPIEGGLLELTPTGFRVKHPSEASESGDDYQFKPATTLSGTDRLLTISPGFVYLPAQEENDEQLPGMTFPWMPKLGSVPTFLDDSAPENLVLTGGQVNVVILEVNLSTRTNALGDTKVPPSSGTLGMQTLTTVVTGHDHQPATTPIDFINAGIPDTSPTHPEFKVKTVAQFYALSDTATRRHYPAFRFDLNSDGSINKQTDYMRGPFCPSIYPAFLEPGSSTSTTPTQLTQGNFPLHGV